MNRNTPHIILILVFVFRVMLPIGNPLYFFSELNMGSNDLLNTLYYVSLLLEVAALVMLALGMNDPKARRIIAYIAFGLPGLHYAAILAAFIPLLPTVPHKIALKRTDQVKLKLFEKLNNLLNCHTPVPTSGSGSSVMPRS